MNALIPVWIIGAPFIGLLILSVAFGSSNATAGNRLESVPGRPGAY